MTIETPTAIVAGWYADPAGSAQLRWWSGAGWTEHLAPIPLAPQPMSQGVQPYQYNPAATVRAHGPISNRSAWLSLGLGSFAIILVVAHIALGQGGFIVTTSGVTSIIWGIRALVLRHNRQSTNLWAPIVGMLFGSTASIISLLMIAGIFHPTSITPTYTGTTSSGTGSVATGPHVYPANPALSAVQSEESNIVSTLEDTVTGGGNTLPAGDQWPTSLEIAADSKILTSDGSDIGTLPTGMALQYMTSADGNFVLQMRGSDQTEISVYDSATNQFSAVCPTTDSTCQPA
jgi:hypothetical protein